MEEVRPFYFKIRKRGCKFLIEQLHIKGLNQGFTLIWP